MSINFHSNQYEGSFDSKHIQNWENPKNTIGKYPETREGFSTVHANDRGHLLSGVPRRRESPWGTFVGTWDMPTKIPGNKQTNPTARSEDAHLKMTCNQLDAKEVLSGGLKRCKIPSPQPVKIDEEALPERNMPMQPLTPNAATFLATKGTLTPPSLPMTHQVIWPRHVPGDADLPVGNAASPKPPTPMPLGGDTVQREAAQRVSPVNPEQVAVRGAVATPVEPVYGQMRTPEANVNWPLVKSTEPPVM